MKKIFFLAVIGIWAFAQNICGLSPNMVEKIIYTYNYAKKYQAPDGTTFNEAISTIFLLESGLGRNWLGDINKNNENSIINNLVEASFGPGQIKLSTALLMIKTFPYLYKYGYLYHKNIFAFEKYNYYFKKMAYFYRILNSPVWKKRWKEGKKLAVKKWAIREYDYYVNKYKKYLNVANKDLEIIKMLKDNYNFSIQIGVAYLIYNYELAKKKGLSYPYYRAISAYNGGWNNKNYLKKFFKYRKYIRCLERHHILSP